MNATFARIPARAAAVDLTETDWRVLHAICIHADKTGHAYPSLARIAQIARINRNHVSRSTKRLREFGLLSSKRLQRGKGWGNTHYQVVYDPPAEVAPTVVAPKIRVAPVVVAGGTCGGSTGGTCDGALTYQLTDQETDLSQLSEVGGYREIDGRMAPETVAPQGVLNTEDTQSKGVITRDNTTLCGWYITDDHGYRTCRKPTYGARYCPEHEQRAAERLPG